jgi:Leucine-rich repeat (LRR) protein
MDVVLQETAEDSDEVVIGSKVFSVSKDTIIRYDDPEVGLQQLPKEIWRLKKAELISLRGNHLETFPAPHPEGAKFMNLKILDLSGNRLRTIPTSVWRGMPNLEELYLWETKFSWSRDPVPTDPLDDIFSNLPSLRKFVLTANDAEGPFISLPESVLGLTQLTELDLTDTPVIMLPASIGKMTQLQVLSVSGSRMFPLHLPKSMAGLKNLQSLTLNHVERVPPFFGNLTELRALTIMASNLSAIPKSFSQLVNIESLNLSYNQLDFVPQAIKHMKQIQILRLDINHIKHIPYWIGDLKHMRLLSASYNHYLTSVSSGVGESRSLQMIFLNDDDKLETIPEQIFHIPTLVQLNIARSRVMYLPGSVVDRVISIYTNTQMTVLVLEGGLKIDIHETPLKNSEFIRRIAEMPEEERVVDRSYLDFEPTTTTTTTTTTEESATQRARLDPRAPPYHRTPPSLLDLVTRYLRDLTY